MTTRLLNSPAGSFATQIVETFDGQVWQVRETGSPDLAHVWLGVAGKIKNGVFVAKPNKKGSGNRPQLVSKAHLYRVHVLAANA